MAATVKSKASTAVGSTDADIGEQLAGLAMNDQGLSEIRGGLDLGSGVVLNFAFREATYVNNDLVHSIVVPTITVTPSTGTTAVGGGISNVSPQANQSINIPSLAGLAVSAPASNTAAMTVGSTILNNGTIQTQVGSAVPAVQALVSSGVTSIVSSLGGGGITNVIGNTANNQLVQQVTTVDIGISGLSQLLQQSIPSAVMSRLTPAAGGLH